MSQTASDPITILIPVHNAAAGSTVAGGWIESLDKLAAGMNC